MFSKGKGWHEQSVRHSRAKKLGKAGGIYSSKINKSRSYSQLKKAGIKLPKKGDADKDGVKNAKDCRPLNKKKQGLVHEMLPFVKQRVQRDVQQRYNQKKELYPDRDNEDLLREATTEVQKKYPHYKIKPEWN